MYRRCSVVLVSLFLDTAAVFTRAQSGRGRQIRIQQTLHGEVVGPSVAEVLPARRSDPSVPARPTAETRRNSALIYSDKTSNQKKDSGEYHMTRGYIRAGWILLGTLVLVGVAMIANGGDF